MGQINKKICFNLNQSFRTTVHSIVTYSILVYVAYLLYYFPPTKKSENVKVLLQEREHLLEICHQMIKGICFNINWSNRTTLHVIITCSMLVCFIYVLYYIPGRKKKQNFKTLPQEREYGWEISNQIKKEVYCKVNESRYKQCGVTPHF